MRSRFWLSLISKFYFGIAWASLVTMIVYGAYQWMDIKESIDRYGTVKYGKWEGVTTFLTMSFYGVVAFTVLMVVSALLQLALDAHARTSRA